MIMGIIGNIPYVFSKPMRWFQQIQRASEIFDANSHTFKKQVRSQRRTDGFGSGNRCLCLPLSLGPADPVASQQVVSHPGGRVEISGRAWLLRPYSWTFTRCASLARGVNYSLAPPKFSHLYLLLTCASSYSLAPPLLLTCASTKI